jgi:hypothetical protein
MGLAAVTDISERSRVVRPRSAAEAIGRALEAVIMTVFAAIGWIAGGFFRVVALCLVSLDYGFRAGAGWPQRQSGDEDPQPEV